MDTYTEPNQNFKCAIPIDGVNRPLIFDLRYNSQAGYWTAAITDELTGEMLADSIPLLDGIYPAANILEQIAYLKIGSATIIKTNPDIPFENPNDRTLGAGFELIWGDTL